MDYEEKVKRTLSQWLENHNMRVYWEKKNKFNYQTFNIKGTRNKPDLLIRNKEGGFTSLVEVKCGDDNAGIRKGSKIIDYYKEYVEGISKYYILDIEIIPKYFILATENAIHGHLYDGERIRPLREGSGRDEMSKEYNLVTRGICPYIEYTLTHQHIRQMWDEWKRRKLKVPPTTLGILISQFRQPVIQYQKWNGNKWGQWWEMISISQINLDKIIKNIKDVIKWKKI